MKLILKLTIAFSVVIFLLLCTADQFLKTRKSSSLVSYGEERYIQKNTTFSYSDVARPPEPIERPSNLSQGQREEMRRQRNAERASNIEWIKDAVRKYSPGSWYMLMHYEQLPETAEVKTTDGGIATTEKAVGTYDYLRGRSRIDLLASMETNVHELTHAYFDQNSYKYLSENKLKLNPENAQGYIYISPATSFFVSFPLKAMFPSGKLSGIITDNLRTYRFDTYINGTTSTQSDGIIGLISELNAYYIGSEYCFNMFEPYKEATGSESSGLFEWVTHTQSTMSAFFEFDYFIKEYLLIMKKDHRSDYEMLKSYTPFTEAYSTLLQLYSELIDKYQERIKREMKLLDSSGEAGTYIEKGWLWIKAGNSHISSGTPIFSKDRETLTPLLESRRYREIEKDFNLR